MKKFSDFTEREVLAVAIASEEEDGRIYMSFAENLVERYPESARIFEQMAEEEKGHRHMLLKLYEQRFGPNLPPIRREDVKGFLRRRPIWLTRPAFSCIEGNDANGSSYCPSSKFRTSVARPAPASSVSRHALPREGPKSSSTR
jgi:Rubrerythrin